MNKLIFPSKMSEKSCSEQTAALQKKFNQCNETEGGTVEIEAGIYTIGSVRLFSNTTLILRSGCIINSSLNLQDFTDFGEKTGINYVDDPFWVNAWHLPKEYFHALICAYDARNITIQAEPGVVINGQNLTDPAGEEGFRGPMGLVFARINNLKLSGYQMINSANWSHAIVNCRDVHIDNVRITAGHDGFNLHHSDQIEIDNCHFETGDDCLAGYDIRKLIVKNTWFNTACNDLRISGKNIKITNCSFIGPGSYPHLADGNYETHDFFRYYAINSKTEKMCESVNIELSHFQVSDCRSVIRYDFESDDHMQSGARLQDISFDNFVIDQIRECSKINSGNHELTIKLMNGIISQSADEPLFMVNSKTKLILKNILLMNPVRIIKNKTEIKLSGLVNQII